MSDAELRDAVEREVTEALNRFRPESNGRIADYRVGNGRVECWLVNEATRIPVQGQFVWIKEADLAEDSIADTREQLDLWVQTALHLNG